MKLKIKYLILLKFKFNIKLHLSHEINHNQAEAFISIFFAGLDIVIYLLIITLFGCEFRSIDSSKQKFSIFLLLDAVIRIIKIYTDVYINNFIQEIVFSLVASIQFYLSISILNQIFSDKNNDHYLDNELHIKNKFFFSFIFFFLVFSLKGLLTNYSFLSMIQYICILISISIFYKYISNKISLFISNIERKNPQFKEREIIIYLPFFIFLSFIIYYALQLLGLLINNKLFESYLIMICIIFKEIGKYMDIILLISIFYSFNKYIKEQNSSLSIKPVINNKVTVYKDEESQEIN